MLEFLGPDEFSSLKINSADPDKMEHTAAFHLDLHYMPKVSSAQRVKKPYISYNLFVKFF